MDLVWPAVAGNVAWSLITMVLAERGGHGGAEHFSFAMRILSLTFVAFYLMASWTRDKEEKKKNSERGYFLLNGFFALAVSVFAIAVSLDNSKDPFPVAWVDGSLAAIFFSAGIGHLKKIWTNSRPRLGWIEIFCGAIALIQCFCFLIPDKWRIPFPDSLYRPIILLIVIIAWDKVPLSSQQAEPGDQ